MPPGELYAAFLAAAFVCAAAPGPDNLCVLSLGISRGRAAGLGFALGCAAGCLAHTAFAVAGLSAVVAASPALFLSLKVVGAAYLVWLGLQAIRAKAAVEATARPGPDRGCFVRGLAANAVNPKVALFFLAFLPQFVDPARPVALQLGVLGVSFAAASALVFALIGYFSARLGEGLRRRPAVGLWLNRLSGGVFFGLALHLAFGRKP